MTFRERAEQSMSFQFGDTIIHMKGRFREAQINAIEQAIIAAVEEEREACAKIVYKQFIAYQQGEQPASALVVAAEAQIRARCNNDGGTK